MPIKIDSKYISGVGTLICCKYKNQDCIVLGREKNKSEYLEKDQYEEFGGSVSNDNECIEKNALYELNEETANMIDIKDVNIFNQKLGKINNYVDLELKHRQNSYYRCYFLRIDQINDKIFKNNLKILKKNKDTLKSYLEIDKLVCVPIENFKNFDFNFEINNGYYDEKEIFLNINDINNKNIRISDRTRKILLVFLEQINKKKINKLKINGLQICEYMCKKKHYNIKLKKIKNKNDMFTNNTTSFVDI
jgi:hypothetical protein